MAKKSTPKTAREKDASTRGKLPKGSTEKKAAKPSTAREKLEKELVSLLPEIDAEGLLFLVRQANVLLHNKRVEELNAEIEKEQKDKKPKRAGTTARVGENVTEITVEIQQSPDGKTYYMLVDGQRHFFTAEEMASIVKLSFKPERKSDALRFLYQFLDAERKEVLLDHGISTGKHPFFEALFYEVRAKFSLNE